MINTTKEKIHLSGTTARVANTSQIIDKLPVKVWSLNLNSFTGFYLEEKEDFTVPHMYGDTSYIERMLKSIERTEKNLGIMLSGYKGTGKTLTAKRLCIESGLPVILVTQAYSGDEFNNFITSPALGKYILFFDEYEKVYGKGLNEDNNNGKKENSKAGVSLLSIMDGICPHTQIIFLMTMNEWKNVDNHLINRPSRIRYHKRFTNLSVKEISEYCDENLSYPEYKNDILQISVLHGKMTWDILKSLIEEVNLLDESPYVLVQDMNIMSDSGYYSVKVTDSKGNEYECAPLNIHFGEVISVHTHSTFSTSKKYEKQFDCDFYVSTNVSSDDIKYDEETESFTFEILNLCLGTEIRKRSNDEEDDEVNVVDNCKVTLTPTAVDSREFGYSKKIYQY